MRSKILFLSFLTITISTAACSDDSITIPYEFSFGSQEIEITSAQICDAIPNPELQATCKNGQSLSQNITVNLSQFTQGKLVKKIDAREQFEKLPEVGKFAYYAISGIEIEASVKPSENNIGLGVPEISIMVRRPKSNEAKELATIQAIEANSKESFSVTTDSNNNDTFAIIKTLKFEAFPQFPASYVIPKNTRIKQGGKFVATITPKIRISISASNIIERGFQELAEFLEL